MLSVDDLIDLLQLEPLPVEGGFFRQTYRSSDTLALGALPARYRQPRPAGSAIYYLLHGAHVSALHRLLTDEVYHFYLGDPVELLLLHPGGASEVVVLGTDLAAGQRPQCVVPHGVWQGSRVRPGGRYALLGTTLAPGWDAEEFELAQPEVLLAEYPAQAALIQALAPPGGG